jgi:hypothetical protein
VTREDAGSEAQTVQSIEKALAKPGVTAKDIFGKETIAGYPASLELARSILDYSRSIVLQWKAHVAQTGGEMPMMTREPMNKLGGTIPPSQKARFTRPILVLINELSISCGDFFPAILQDNKRAVLFGVRTSGAGGYVQEQEFHNSLGISKIRITSSIAVRANGRPIENLGVSPDIRYKITADDIRNGYGGYAAAVNKAMAEVMGGGDVRPRLELAARDGGYRAVPVVR